MFRTSQFDKLFEKATSNLHLEPDWPTIILICDLVRQGDVQPKIVLAAVKKKLTSPNPHVALFTLQVLESLVKNCGALIHEEIGTRSYMDMMKDLVKNTQHENVRNKILELLQAWAYAFRNTPKYRAVQDTVNLMKTVGLKFPPLKECDAMFVADVAPEWADGQCCHRCRVQFSVMQRKHHCRACGQVFCHQCTSKSCTLPKFGIEKEVRVCDSCYEKFTKPCPANATQTTSKSEDLPIEYLTSSLAQQSQAPPASSRKSDAELREEEELQLALALSQSEAESKTTSKGMHSSPVTMNKTNSYSSSPLLSTSPEDAELTRYLNRAYWQKQSESSSPSAPVFSVANKEDDADKMSKENTEMDEFIHKLRCQIEIFVNRMKSNSSRGRSIANDSSVQTLFLNITEMHSQLLQYVKQLDDKRVYYEGLQDKVTQVRESRAALEALREEHREQMKREAEALERQRQLQMAHKLEIMRKKKQEYLQYQRQLALQRIHEQEREMQMRQEQQKQQNLRGPTYPPYFPQGYDNHVPVSNFPMAQPNAVFNHQHQFHGAVVPEMILAGPGVDRMPGHLMSPMGQTPVHQMPMSHSLPPMVPPPGMLPSAGPPPHSMHPGMPPHAIPPGMSPVHTQPQGLPGPPQVMPSAHSQQVISAPPGMPSQPQGMAAPPSGMPPHAQTQGMTAPPPGMPSHSQPQGMTAPPPGMPSHSQPQGMTVPPPGMPSHSQPQGMSVPPPGMPAHSQPQGMPVPPPGMPIHMLQPVPYDAPSYPNQQQQQEPKEESAELISFD